MFFKFLTKWSHNGSGTEYPFDSMAHDTAFVKYFSSIRNSLYYVLLLILLISLQLSDFPLDVKLGGRSSSEESIHKGSDFSPMDQIVQGSVYLIEV